MIVLLLLYKSIFTLDDNYPIRFLVENEKLYATSAHVGQDILVIPASSTPVEEVFFQS